MAPRKKHTIEDIRYRDNYISCHDGWEGLIGAKSEDDLENTWDYHVKTPERVVYEPPKVWSKRMTIPNTNGERRPKHEHI